MNIERQNHVIRLIGMLDSNSAPEFDHVAKQVIEEAPGPIVLDLSEMTYTSSQGLRIILALQKGITANGGTLTVRGVQPAVMEVFQMTGFDNVLTIE